MIDSILTIAIPVYNGGDYIGNTLESIIKQSEFQSNKVVILISDNSSTDTTQSICLSYVKRFEGKINYHRQAQNLGYDGNIIFLVNTVTTEYVWLLGCQDYLLDGSLSSILEIITQYSPHNIFLNFLIYNEKNNSFSDSESYKLTEDNIYFEPNEVYLKNGIGIGTALSTNIFQTDKINTKLYFKNWAHLEILHNMLTTNPKTITVQTAKKAFVLYRESHGWWESKLLLDNSLELAKIFRFYYQKRYPEIVTNHLSNKSSEISLLMHNAKQYGRRVSLVELLHISKLYCFTYKGMILFFFNVFLDNKTFVSIGKTYRRYKRLFKRIREHLKKNNQNPPFNKAIK